MRIRPYAMLCAVALLWAQIPPAFAERPVEIPNVESRRAVPAKGKKAFDPLPGSALSAGNNGRGMTWQMLIVDKAAQGASYTLNWPGISSAPQRLQRAANTENNPKAIAFKGKLVQSKKNGKSYDVTIKIAPAPTDEPCLRAGDSHAYPYAVMVQSDYFDNGLKMLYGCGVMD
ncbi:MAG: hypothetical protein E6Q88_04055 [Lysobacteraceae bacterium]|nr:MAG: hypothetical protein E6Q88_04055 [Xanthomonadaceae bacterium]